MTSFVTRLLYRSALFTLAWGLEALPAAAEQLRARDSFDFYVLALSWSPAYCETEGDASSPLQCNSGRRYGFVVHGLWPQYERGYPENCATSEPLDVPRERLRSLYDLMPSAGLIRYQWRVHGTCAGLSQDDYFDVLRAARTRVAIPDGFRAPKTAQRMDPSAVEQSFVAANPAMSHDGVAVTCDDGYLREVRICMTKALEFRACPRVDRRACEANQITVLPVR